jgi:hypothetical protein
MVRQLLAIVLLPLVLPIFFIGAQPVMADAVADETDAVTAAAVAAAVAFAETETPTRTALRHLKPTTLSRCAECLRSSPCGLWALAIVLIVVLGVIAILLIRAARFAQKSVSISTLTTSFFFWLGVGNLILLLVIGIFYAVQRGSNPPYMLGGLLPIAVPWFGALGAVTISLAGVFFYSDQGWDKKYNYWHIGRPLFGAVLGAISYFMFILIVSSAGTKIPILEKGSHLAKDYIVYYVLAFLVGYREETFRELIQRVAELILKPGNPASAGTPTTADSPSVSFKRSGGAITSADLDTRAGSPLMWTIDVANDGKGSLKSPAAVLDKSSDKEFTMDNNRLAGLVELKRGEARSVNVTFSPTGPGTFKGALIVTGSNLDKAARLPLTGKS